MATTTERTGIVKYKNQYNQLVSDSKYYISVCDSFASDIYRRFGFGHLEFMYIEKRYHQGDFLDSNSHFLGLPFKFLSRLDTQYNSLITNINSGLTHIQSFIPKGASIEDEEYVKTTLLTHAQEQFKSLKTTYVNKFLQIKDAQLNCSTRIDRFNLVTGSSNDGIASGASGSRIICMTLSGDEITTLTNDIRNVGYKIEKYTSTLESLLDDSYLTLGTKLEEYIFFNNIICNQQTINRVNGVDYTVNAGKLFEYRKAILIEDLTTTKTNFRDGIHSYLVPQFKSRIEEFASELITFDVKRYEQIFDVDYGLNKIAKKQIDNLLTSDNDYSVNYTGKTTEIKEVMKYFENSRVGTLSSDFNFKTSDKILLS